jgi:hypothetical protein
MRFLCASQLGQVGRFSVDPMDELSPLACQPHTCKKAANLRLFRHLDLLNGGDPNQLTSTILPRKERVQNNKIQTIYTPYLK